MQARSDLAFAKDAPFAPLAKRPLAKARDKEIPEYQWPAPVRASIWIAGAVGSWSFILWIVGSLTAG